MGLINDVGDAILFQGLVKIGNDVFIVFNSNIHTDQSIGNAIFFSLVLWHTEVRHRSRVAEQGIDGAK
jgi:hypothetical protein